MRAAPHDKKAADDNAVATIARKFRGLVYAVLTLSAGNVVFDEIRVLETHEFNGKAILDVPHDPALRLADRNDSADGRPQLCRDADSGA